MVVLLDFGALSGIGIELREDSMEFISDYVISIRRLFTLLSSTPW